METPYNSDNWDELSQRGKLIHIHNFFLSGNEFGGWKLHDRIAPQELPTGTITSYVWINEKNEKQMLRLDTLESKSAKQAQEGLKDVLGNIMHPELIQLNAEKQGVGDISFGTGTAELNSLFFLRSNLVFRLLNMTGDLFAVNEIGKALDHIITDKPTPSEKGVIPEIRKFEAGQGTVNSPSTIEVDAADPLDRPVWLKFVVESGEVSQSEKGFQYANAVAGKYDLKVFALNENGFVGGASVGVEVGG